MYTNMLITGGTGKTGSRIVDRLQKRNISLRIGSRSADIPFDWYDDGTWSAALQNIDAVYVCFQPDLAIPAAVPIIRSFTDEAKKAGVGKLVLLSGRGETEAEACENIISKSGLDWTIIRAAWFFQNFSESHLVEPILAGHMALPVGEVREPFIDADDIADVAVAALTDTRHNNQLYEVTGGELMTFSEAVAQISAASGRFIGYEKVKMEQYKNMLSMHGVPAEYISLLDYLFTTVMDGRNESTAAGVYEALGRRPRKFSDYVAATVAKGAWG